MKALSLADLRCPVTGQAAFAARERAQKLQERGGRNPVTVYKCRHCGWWHLSKSALKCSGTQKTCYSSEANAEKVQERAWTDPTWENRHGSPPTCVYKCDRCGWWHLGRGKRGRNAGPNDQGAPSRHDAGVRDAGRRHGVAAPAAG